MTDASQDMAGTPFLSQHLHVTLMYLSVYYIAFALSLVGVFLDTAAEEQRVNLRVDSLLPLARDNNIDFWADEARYRRIVQFQDRATQTRKFLISSTVPWPGYIMPCFLAILNPKILLRS
jgi:hypothetical protein